MPNVVLTPHIAATREEPMGNILPEVGASVARATQPAGPENTGTVARGRHRA